MHIGIIPAITQTVSDDIVLHAQATRIAISRNVLVSLVLLRFSLNVAAQARTLYLLLLIEDDTPAKRRILRLLAPPLIDMILDIALTTFVALSKAVEDQPMVNRHTQLF